jgi:PleD family two-component response regulator
LSSFIGQNGGWRNDGTGGAGRERVRPTRGAASRGTHHRGEERRHHDKKNTAIMTRRVVIAEDEAIIRLDLKEILLDEGYDVVGETGRGDDAVELVRIHTPDLVILDVKMPGADGLQAARDIRDLDLKVAVLIQSAQPDRRGP